MYKIAINDAKIVIKTQIHSPAKIQKFLMLLNGLVTPIENAMMSVSDVIVTEMADER